jgi:hypothetical protein
MSDRILRSIGYLSLMARGPGDTRDEAPVSREETSAATRGRALERLAQAYGEDATGERARTRVSLAAASLLLVAGVALAVIGIIDARDRNAFRFGRFAAYGLVSLVVITFVAVALRHASQHRHAEQEARRLQRHFQAVDPYLASMPQPLADLLRGTLVASLFSRLPSEEPWREPQWPDAQALLSALNMGEATAVSGPRERRSARLLRRLRRSFSQPDSG